MAPLLTVYRIFLYSDRNLSIISRQALNRLRANSDLMVLKSGLWTMQYAMNSLALDLIEAFIGDLAQDGDLQPVWFFQLLLEELLVVRPVFGLVVLGEFGFDSIYYHGILFLSGFLFALLIRNPTYRLSTLELGGSLNVSKRNIAKVVAAPTASLAWRGFIAFDFPCFPWPVP